MGIDTGLRSEVRIAGRCRPPATLHTTKPLEREAGIEPASLAWKARVLPLNYSRLNLIEPRPERVETILFALVEEAGFEPAYSLEGRFTVCCH